MRTVATLPCLRHAACLFCNIELRLADLLTHLCKEKGNESVTSSCMRKLLAEMNICVFMQAAHYKNPTIYTLRGKAEALALTNLNCHTPALNPTTLLCN